MDTLLPEKGFCELLEGVNMNFTDDNKNSCLRSVESQIYWQTWTAFYPGQ